MPHLALVPLCCQTAHPAHAEQCVRLSLNTASACRYVTMPRLRGRADRGYFYEGTRPGADRPRDGSAVLFLVPFGNWWVATHAPLGSSLTEVMGLALDTRNWAFRSAEAEYVLGAGAHVWEAPRGFVRWLPGPFNICFCFCMLILTKQ